MPRSPQAQPNWTATRTHPAAPPPSRAAVAAPTIIRSIRAPAGSSLPKKLADSDRRPLAFKRGEAAQCTACKAWMAAPEDRRANAITCAQCYNTIWPPQHEELWHDHDVPSYEYAVPQKRHSGSATSNFTNHKRRRRCKRTTDGTRSALPAASTGPGAVSAAAATSMPPPAPTAKYYYHCQDCQWSGGRRSSHTKYQPTCRGTPRGIR